MKAARVEDGVLTIRDHPMPVPGEGDALIRITAAGVCHSDLHLARGEWMSLPPIVNLGHEAIGIVEALGPGADRFVQVGDRVILGLGGSGGGYWCGACRFCLSGQPRHCAESKGIIGTFAEYFCVWARSLVTIPASLGDHEAPLACGGLTAYGAVKKLLDHRVLPGRPVAIVGAAGGLGHYAVQLAKTFGYQVIGVDVGAERLDFVKSLGADLSVDAADPTAASRSCSASSAGSTRAWSSRRRWPASASASICSAGTRLFVAVGIPAASEGNFVVQPVPALHEGPDDHLLGRRHRAGHARAHRPRRSRARQKPCLAGRRDVRARRHLRRARRRPLPRPRRPHRS